MGIQTASQAYTNEGLGGFSFRNKIINGAMEIDQRNAGAEVNPATHNGYQLDRWTTFMDVSNKFKVQQLTTSPPAGFTHYMRLTVTNAYTSSSGERFALNQKIEGYNLIDTEYGLATAKPMTLSFWVRSSLTGTFGGTIHGETATSYYYPFSYTISSANTWEKKTVSILPLTASTPNSRTTGTGMRVWFDLGSGDTQAAGAWSTTAAYTATGAQKWLSNAGATLDFTGVQLEIGNQATPFERRNFGTELALCQRYFWRVYGQNIDIAMNNQTAPYSSVTFSTLNNPVTMRASGTFAHNMTNAKNTTSTPGADQWAWYIQNQGYGSTSSGDIANLNGGGQLYCRIGAYTLAPTAASTGIRMGTNIYIENSAEL